jgi:hypothetical protein
MRSNILDRVWDIPVELADLEAKISMLRFAQLELVAELDALIPPGFPDAAREEVAVACRVSCTQAQRRLDTARALIPARADGSSRLAATADAMSHGEITIEHAAELTSATAGLDDTAARWVEQQVLSDDRVRTPGQAGWWARKRALQVGADRAQRQAAAAAARTLRAWDFSGEVTFSWTMPAVDASIVETCIEALSARQGADDQRPAAQRRGDALFELVARTLEHGQAGTGTTGTRNLPRVEVLVTHESLLDHVWHDAQVEQRSVFGQQVRQLSCDADLQVTMVNSFGSVLGQGNTTRVVNARLRALLELRDQHCRFPGCTTRPRYCHAHHIWHWADGGPTDPDNLLLICERHHHAIHDGGWTVAFYGDGAVLWTSPTGQVVRTPADLDQLTSEVPPWVGYDDDHPDGSWIRPEHDFFRRDPDADTEPPDPKPAATSAFADEPPF